jgi:hypothetical protein
MINCWRRKKFMERTLIIARLIMMLLMLASFANGCGCSPTDWQMDYGKPAAQFLSGDVARLGGPYIGRKITVKGTVMRIDAGDSKSAWVYLVGGIRCHFGKFKAMAESAKVGDLVYVDGFLRRCDPGDILIDPAVYRLPDAPFSPKK